MAFPADELTPLFRPGQRITGQTTAAVIGKRFLKISGNFTSGPDGTVSTYEGGNVQVAHADAATGNVAGVASYDAASGGKVGIVHGGVIPVTASGSITAGSRVEVATGGKAATLASGVAVALAFSSATDGNDVYVRMIV